MRARKGGERCDDSPRTRGDRDPEMVDLSEVLVLVLVLVLLCVVSTFLTVHKQEIAKCL